MIEEKNGKIILSNAKFLLGDCLSPCRPTSDTKELATELNNLLPEVKNPEPVDIDKYEEFFGQSSSPRIDNKSTICG